MKILLDECIDQKLRLRERQMAPLILCAPTNRLADLRFLVPAALRALAGIARGQVLRIE